MANVGVQSGLAPSTWREYEPQLLCAANGAVTHPDLGTTPTRQGRYIELDGLVMAQVKIVSSISGTSAGSGDCYVVSLPVPAARPFTGSHVIGQGFPYRAVTGVSYEWVCVATLADQWTSLNGEWDSYCQFATPWTMLIGSETISASATSITVTHDLGYAPDASDIEVNLTQAPGGSGATSRWPLVISSITSSQFKASSLGGGTMSTTTQTMEWKIRAEPKSATSGSWLIGPKYARPFTALSSLLFQVYYEPA